MYYTCVWNDAGLEVSEPDLINVVAMEWGNGEVISDLRIYKNGIK